ncbi:MAG: family oxidoreductase [Ramlibacter sp.]|nr:family oxidoreductase [Ramlibacter sp.]
MPYATGFRPGLFAGRTYIVTGGGSGIGRCTAHELAALGAHAALVGRTPEKLERVAGEIAEDGGHASAWPCDIRDELQVRATVQGILQARGRIDGLVNNAGGQYRSELRDISTKGFEAVVRNNLTGGFIFMRETYTQWMEARGGSIVNIIADIWNGWPNFSHSAAARGGMHTLTECAACEWSAAGVRVNSVAPGAIMTSGLDTYEAKDDAYIKRVPTKVPMQRFGTEAEVSAAIVFLLSPMAAYITGSCVRVDGGAPNAREVWWPLQAHDKAPAFDGFHRAVKPGLFSE